MSTVMIGGPPPEWEARSVEKKLEFLARKIANAPGMGGETNSMALGGILAVLSMMKVDSSSFFLDLGCGYGMPVFAAKLAFRAKTADGIDYNKHAVDFAVARRQELFPEVRRMSFMHGDILEMDSLPCGLTHVYMADTAYPPTVMNKLIELLNANDEWTYLASNNVVTEDLAGATLIGSVQTRLSGSNNSRKMKVFYRA